MVAFQASFPPFEENGFQEVDWLPSQEDIDRARRELERAGVLAGLRREVAAGGSSEIGAVPGEVPPGETPWRWLIGGLAWVIVWPAVIALHFGQGRWPWLPWWLPLTLAALHMAVLVIPVVRASRRTDQSLLRRQFGKIRTLPQMCALEPEEFETWVGLLFHLRGFRVHNTRFSGDHGVDLEVSGGGVQRGLVQCKRYRGTVGEPVVRELYGTHIHENADFSWLATTGAISRRAREWAAGKPIDLWDGQRLVELARKYR